MRWISIVILSAVLATAGGCGKKGALYLPEKALAAKPAAPAAGPEPAKPEG